MALATLHQEVIEKMADRFPNWRFVTSTRSFVRQNGNCKWYLHLAFVNHVDDFDVVVDLAVEHLMGKQRICILGAELGNILGTGQHRWSVGPNSSALAAAKSVQALFDEVGVPFLKRFTELAEVVRILRTDEKTTRLIFPFEQNPALEADRIASLMEEKTLR
jgi:hypothetical protein